MDELKKLRARFLTGNDLQSDYWTESLLETYARTLGERIRWKWQHFLADIYKLGLAPEQILANQNFVLEDWGCGPGTASLAFLEHSSQQGCYRLDLSDRSQMAVRFATERLQKQFPHLQIHSTNAPANPPLKIRLVSYVLSELGGQQLSDLQSSLRSVDLLLWVDAGSLTESRRLSRLRDELLSDFHFLAPCPHQARCPALTDTSNWCHRFAKPPGEVFHSSEWGRIARDLKIDLRSLPYHSLYAVKKSVLAQMPALPAKRQIGRARILRRTLQRDFCCADGTLKTETLTEREDRVLYKKIKKRQDS